MKYIGHLGLVIHILEPDRKLAKREGSLYEYWTAYHQRASAKLALTIYRHCVEQAEEATYLGCLYTASCLRMHPYIASLVPLLATRTSQTHI